MKVANVLFFSWVALAVSAFGQTNPQPFEGVISVFVDATDLAQRIFRVKENIPVKPGPLSLWLPEWIPGTHAPNGAVSQLAGLTITANGKPVEWKRDTLDVFLFKVNVPEGVKNIELSYESITPAAPFQGRVVMTPAMFNLQWISLVMYPAGYANADIQFKASLKVPPGWKAFCALELDSKSGDTYHYKTINFGDLADSPVFAGKYSRTFDLDPGAKIPVRLNVVADDPSFLDAKDDHIAAHRNLVKQAYKLYHSQHYNHYDFLLSLSKQQSGIGLEHHRSSENGVSTNYFKDWDPKEGSSSLLGHEFTHSWNGKFRRPEDLTQPNFNLPMQNSLLWVYEGQTSYWGDVLTARAGLQNTQTAIDYMAISAAKYAENRPGFSWRALQDTTNDPIIGYSYVRPYMSWQMRTEYYSAAAMMWLEADVLIRQKTDNKKSLDDFANAFFSVDNGSWKVKTYTFEDVVKTLNDIFPNDWSTFLRTRLDGHGSFLAGIEASGWRLVFKDTPSGATKSAAKEEKGSDFTYSLGFHLDGDAKFTDVRWDGPAFKAGVGTGMTLLAVNDRQYTKDYLEIAIADAKKTKKAINLIVKDFDIYKNIKIDYTGGLRYPHLERIEGKTDYLTPILSAK